MALRDLPLMQTHKKNGPEWSESPRVSDSLARSNGRLHQNAHRGAAYTRARDAYHDVPILQEPTWGHEIAAYFYLGGVSAGAYVVAALAETVGGTRLKTLARAAHYVAFATLLPCAPLLIADLGRPSRFHHMLRIFKPSSPMNLGAWTLTLHGAMSTITTLRVLAGEDKLPVVGGAVRLLPARALAVGGLPSALALGGYTGVLLGTTAVPVWSASPVLGGLFMASAMSTGTAAAGLATTLSGSSRPAEEQTLAPFKLACGATELGLLTGYLATSGRAATPLLKGKTGLLMAGATMALLSATACELAGLRALENTRSTLSVMADSATLLGGALLRWAVVQAGKTSASDRDGTLAATEPSRRAPGWGASRQ